MIETLSDLVRHSASRDAGAPALQYKKQLLSYGELEDAVSDFAAGLIALGLGRSDRVAVFCDKRPQTVIAMFAAIRAGGVFVPVNGLLKPKQVSYILRDCNVQTLVTTRVRAGQLAAEFAECPDLKHIVVVDGVGDAGSNSNSRVVSWEDVTGTSGGQQFHRVISSDMAAIMYTSGSTGLPKGVVLSHGNMTIGAESVAAYIGNTPADRILSALPLSFDAGLSQVTTGFFAGACVILHDYLLARDVVRLIERESVTGLTAVPPMWIQLSEQQWPDGAAESLRYFANTGGKMPRDTLAKLRRIFGNAQPFLMYGLTESFRSTYLPPSEVEQRPDSMGKAIPNVEVMVVRPDGRPCGAGEVGELVHRGPLVSLGYWNDPARTAERFKPAPMQPAGIPNPEIAVWSGDSVKMDEDGYLYFVGRKSEMIKTSGYRVSPTEIEEVAFDTGLVAEVAALGIQHGKLEQAIVLVAQPVESGKSNTESLLEAMRPNVPGYMMPTDVIWRDGLPHNANGKLDRKALAEEHAELYASESVA